MAKTTVPWFESRNSKEPNYEPERRRRVARIPRQAAKWKGRKRVRGRTANGGWRKAKLTWGCQGKRLSSVKPPKGAKKEERPCVIWKNDHPLGRRIKAHEENGSPDENLRGKGNLPKK